MAQKYINRNEVYSLSNTINSALLLGATKGEQSSLLLLGESQRDGLSRHFAIDYIRYLVEHGVDPKEIALCYIFDYIGQRNAYNESFVGRQINDWKKERARPSTPRVLPFVDYDFSTASAVREYGIGLVAINDDNVKGLARHLKTIRSKHKIVIAVLDAHLIFPAMLNKSAHSGKINRKRLAPAAKGLLKYLMQKDPKGIMAKFPIRFEDKGDEEMSAYYRLAHENNLSRRSDGKDVARAMLSKGIKGAYNVPEDSWLPLGYIEEYKKNLDQICYTLSTELLSRSFKDGIITPESFEAKGNKPLINQSYNLKDILGSARISSKDDSANRLRRNRASIGNPSWLQVLPPIERSPKGVRGPTATGLRPLKSVEKYIEPTQRNQVELVDINDCQKLFCLPKPSRFIDKLRNRRNRVVPISINPNNSEPESCGSKGHRGRLSNNKISPIGFTVAYGRDVSL